ncbi:7-cyano-7-deazaguanine synthase QueC [Acidithiobacillus caldus]
MGDSEKAAIVLLSGGLDSATVLAIAREAGFALHALSFDYGQRHATELQFARKLAEAAGVRSHRVLKMDLRIFGASALTDERIAVPEEPAAAGIPITYVPARNTLFLSYALALAEVLGVLDIFIGVNSQDYSGYPDCRPEFIQRFQELAQVATVLGTEKGQKLSIHAPLQYLSKAQIIRRGLELGVDYAHTRSCYQLDSQGRSCGRCDSCRLRLAGFAELDLRDPAPYI